MPTLKIGTLIDLQKLIDTRLLIQAGSGGGKSFALRKLAETCSGHVQQIILDPEGEFVTLREKFDFALIGKEGDIPLNLKYAETLAHKLLETNLSAIIDLYELKAHERILFVKRFLEALVNAPKGLWHSCLVYVDEAHIFCPESSKSESASAVIDLCTRGRKRGYCAILATQRLSKLHKDAAAECRNKMIGSTSLDIDRKRAGEELGFVAKVDVLELRNLKAGEFYAFGPAISNEVIKFKVADVETTHLKSGGRMAVSPPTPNAIKKILTRLQDIPEEAEKELQTKAQLEQEVRRLKTELSKVAANPSHTPELKSLKEENESLRKAIRQEIAAKEAVIKKYYDQLCTAHRDLRSVITGIERVTDPADMVKSTSKSTVITPRSQVKPAPVPRTEKHKDAQAQSEKLKKCPLAIFQFLASYPDRAWSKAQVGIATGYSPGSGGFNNALSELNTKGLIKRQGAMLELAESPDILDYLPADFQTQSYSIDTFKDKLSKCEREIYEVILSRPNDVFSKDTLADATESKYSAISGGFNNALSKLSTLEIISRESGRIQLNPELRELL